MDRVLFPNHSRSPSVLPIVWSKVLAGRLRYILKLIHILNRSELSISHISHIVLPYTTPRHPPSSSSRRPDTSSAKPNWPRLAVCKFCFTLFAGQGIVSERHPKLSSVDDLSLLELLQLLVEKAGNENTALLRRMCGRMPNDLCDPPDSRRASTVGIIVSQPCPAETRFFVEA